MKTVAPSHVQEQLWELTERVSPEADPTSILLFRQLHQANRLLLQTAKKQLDMAGLSWPQFMLLLVLQGNETLGEGGGLKPSELSELQGIPRNAMSEIIATLEKQSLIKRELHGSDRRAFVIRLTPQGRKILKSNIGTQCRQITQCFAAFDSKERGTLLDLLTKLTHSLSGMNNLDTK